MRSKPKLRLPSSRRMLFSRDDSSSSSSSTFSVVEVVKRRLSRGGAVPRQYLPSEARPVKRVRFQDGHTSIKGRQRGRYNAASSWYSNDEIEAFRKSNEALAEKIQRREQSSVLEHSYGRVLKGLYLACSRAPKAQEPSQPHQKLLQGYRDQLQRWILEDPSHTVGMHNIAVEQVVRSRTFRQKKLVQQILTQQHVGGSNIVDHLCNESQRLSQSARLFAEMTALSQAQVSRV